MDKSKIVLSYHAITRFRERSGAKYSDKKLIRKLLTLIANSEECYLKPQFRVISLINNRFEETEYLRAKNGWILVIVNNKLKTIHTGQSDRWEKNAH